MNKLAIVLPAYKSRYIVKTINSILKQTCSNFHLYIGIDGPNKELENILTPFKNHQLITVHEFKENMGLTDLVGQWTRCVNLTNNEEYIWLFPDDDIMSPDCVEAFYKYLSLNPSTSHLMRFKIRRIDENGHEMISIQHVPQKETADEFMYARYTEGRLSSVAEYIFSRKTYAHYNGFYNLPAAWGADDITWYRFAQKNYIVTIPQGIISVRHGELNISNTSTFLSYLKLKGMYGKIHYLLQSGFFYQKEYFNNQNRKKILLEIILNYYNLYQHKFNMKDLLYCAIQNNKILNDGFIKNVYRLSLMNYRYYTKKIKQHAKSIY